MNVGRWKVEEQEEDDEDEEEESAMFQPFSEVFDRRAFLMNLGLWSRCSASQAVKHVAPRQSNDYVVAVGPFRHRAWVAG